MNFKSSHATKGHQVVTGKVYSGNYISPFSSFKFADIWKGHIKSHLQQIEYEFKDMRNSILPNRDGLTNQDISLAYKSHLKRMERFYKSFEGYTAGGYVSLTTCFSCLMEVPEHPLQCGHVFCTGCIKAYGRPYDRTSVLMDFCPLEPSRRWAKSSTIRFKPDYAGVRILTLDG